MSDSLVFETPVPMGESVTRYFQLANASVRLQSVDWVRIESASTPSGIELGTTTTTAHSESDAVAFDLDKSSLRHVPCKLQRHAAIRIGVRFAPILSAASTTATTGGGLVHHRAVLCVAVGVPLAAKRRRRVLRIHLVATALLPTLTAPLVPVAAVTTTAAPAPIKRPSATTSTAATTALKSSQADLPPPVTAPAPAVVSQSAALLESNSKRAMDDWFRRLERRLADVESQMGVVVDLLRDIRARSTAGGGGGGGGGGVSGQHLRHSTDVHDTLLPDEELLDGADDANSDYSRPFHESRGAIDRDVLTTPPPPMSSVPSLGGTKNGLNSWQNYVSKVGAFSPTLARMAHDFELQQLQTPARRRFDGNRLPDTPSQQFGLANRRPLGQFDDDDGDDDDADDDSHDGKTRAITHTIPRKASIYDSFLPSDVDLELF